MLRFNDLRGVVIGTLLAAAGCSRSDSSPAPDPAATHPPATKPQGASSSSSAPLVLARGIRFVKAEAEEDVAKLVRVERARAVADGRDLVVYVGARWCEPCQRFHDAAKRGELDSEFPELTILEFDIDDDRERIVSAGYTSRLIPLFVYPGSDGRASERRFEGGIKGNGAVGDITPRLKRLLGK